MARRTLDHPPSDRYAARPGGGEVAPGDRRAEALPPPEAARRRLSPEASAILVAAAMAAILVIVGGVIGSTIGPVFVAGVGGGLLGLLLAGSSRPRPSLRWVGILLAVAAVLAGAVGSWLIALAEGGTLGPVDFLWATTGLLVPVEAIVAAIAAAWGVGAGPIVD